MTNINAILCCAISTVFATAHGASVSISATAPTVDGADIANLTGTTNLGGDTGHIWSNRPRQGQTFTTGANADGYLLSSVTLQNLNNTVSTSPMFNLLIGTFAGTVLTQVGMTETAVAPSYVALDYITFILSTPVLLNANTQYGFLWGTAGSGFVTSNSSDAAAYTGGNAISSGANNVPDLANVITHSADRVFHVDLAAVPEPTTSLLAVFGGLMLAGHRRRTQRA